MSSTPPRPDSERPLLVQIASYNTNLQGHRGLPQDLVDWLTPTLKVARFLAYKTKAADIIAVGFQELLPLHFGLTGLSKQVMETRHKLILSQIETNAPGGERYVLVGRAVFVGAALLVYARDDGVARRVCDVQTQWTGVGPCYMGNKGAVGVRFRVKGEAGRPDEIFTFVNAHLTAHAHNMPTRLKDYSHIVSTMLFPPLPGSTSRSPTTIYETSHLFFTGDLNFRLAVPPTHQSNGMFLGAPGGHGLITERLKTDEGREELKEFDELTIERRKGTVCVGLREGEFWRFQCTYKFVLGEVDTYHTERRPAWTDRVLYTTHLDKPDEPDVTAIKSVLYESIPSYTTSDHKPIVALLELPVAAPSSTIPLLHHPSKYRPDSLYRLKRWTGKIAGWGLGWVWCLAWLVGAGNAMLGIVNFLIGGAAVGWWRHNSA